MIYVDVLFLKVYCLQTHCSSGYDWAMVTID